MAEAILTAEDLREYVRRKLGENTWDGIHEAIKELKRQTRRGGIIDPFADPSGGLWNLLWNSLYFGARQYHEALTVAQIFLDTYYSLQEEPPNERIHKGTPLQYLGIAYFSLNQMEQSRKFHIFAFIEDVLEHFEQNRTLETPAETVVRPATIVLKTRFRASDKELKDLQDFVWETARTEESFYPEEVYSKFIIESDKRSEIVARSIEERLYRINLHYLRKLKEKAFGDPTGKALELFAFYLFSCVDGFQTVLRKQTPSFHFDVIVRNLIKDHTLLENLGEYIGIECKNIKRDVNAEELDHFIHKLRLHNMKCGIIFTRKGISGKEYGKSYGKLIVDKTFQRDGIIVFALTSDDITKICEGYNLLALILRKYEDTRFK
jgi:hypothetical protein